ncbi:MFS transporter [Cupriavidus sp. TA19]|uniref:MFS transporter n=1 Tax=unclassified Cupriavidus TaxID=2640874 RepID=UPI000ECE680A|nr:MULTISPECIES: MFS transporter [unclassified Cupriavidus]BDB27525.1 MFS transporter [Cupriavidus sp. P-10]GLC97282.1 MFS transporter [Cupriavidus sp. TA19]
MYPPPISIASVIDARPLGAYRLRIFIVCFLIVLMDGFDTQAIGFAAKAMSSSLDIPIALFGQVFSAGLLGAMVGAFLLGPLADRFGRRWLLAASIVIFAVFSLLTPHAPTLPELLLVRFVAGLGLGGAIPNLLALSAEYTPRRMRGMMTGVLYAGFPLGGAVGALASSHIVPHYGWPALFYLGGVLPLALAVLVIVGLPESLPFLLKRKGGQDAVRAIVARIAGRSSAPDCNASYVDAEENVRGLPFRELLSGGRLASTLLLWTGFFMCFVLLIVLVLWTPALLRGEGVGEHDAALVVALINLGSVAGTAAGGRLVDRFGPYLTLPLLFMLGALSVSGLGYVTDSLAPLAIAATLCGVFMGAGSSGLLGLAVLSYPSGMRATGVGWAMALGRMGQVTGPLIVGALLASGFSIKTIFLCSAVPAAIAAAAILVLRVAQAATPAHGDAPAERTALPAALDGR